jgi:type IV secretion system protein VirD4
MTADRTDSMPVTDGFTWIVVGFAAVIVTAWAGAALATLVNGTPTLPGLTITGTALVDLPSHAGDPRSAWPRDMAEHLPGPWAYWGSQLVVVAAVIGVVVLAVRLIAAAGASRPTGIGVARERGFARPRDLRRLVVRTPLAGRVTLGRCGSRLLACEPQASLAVVGPTGCGKTAGFAIPAILEWRGPVLALSVKSDLVEATAKHRSGRGKIWVYDPTGLSVAGADSWSPISSCSTWSHAMRMSAWMTEAAQPRFDSLSDGDYWYSQARKALAPYLHAAALGDKGVVDLVRWIDTQERGEVEDLLRTQADAPDASHSRWDELFDHGVVVARDLLEKRGAEGAELAAQPVEQWPDWLRREVIDAVEAEWRFELAKEGTVGVDQLAPLAAARALWAKEPRLRGSVFATVENVLASWADPSVGTSATTSEIDLTKWLTGDNTLYVVATAHEQARLRPVLTVLVQQAIRQAYDTAAANRGRLPQPCLLLLDEAGNTAPLRDLPAYAATARSHGISLVTVWQDLAQIKALYNDRAQTVLNNHRAKLFGAGIADADTLDYVSRLVGDEAHSERNLSVDLQGGRRSVSQHRSYRRAAPLDVLRRIRPGEGVLLYGSELPAHVRLRTWFEDRELCRTARRPDLVPSRRIRAHLRR